MKKELSEREKILAFLEMYKDKNDSIGNIIYKCFRGQDLSKATDEQLVYCRHLVIKKLEEIYAEAEEINFRSYGEDGWSMPDFDEMWY